MKDLTFTIRVIFFQGVKRRGVLRRSVGREMKRIKEWMSLSDHFGKTYKVFTEEQSTPSTVFSTFEMTITGSFQTWLPAPH